MSASVQLCNGKTVAFDRTSKCVTHCLLVSLSSSSSWLKGVSEGGSEGVFRGVVLRGVVLRVWF